MSTQNQTTTEADSRGHEQTARELENERARLAREVIEHEDRAAFARYGARHWQVTLDGVLLAVVLYKRGASTVCDVLNGKAVIR